MATHPVYTAETFSAPRNHIGLFILTDPPSHPPRSSSSPCTTGLPPSKSTDTSPPISLAQSHVREQYGIGELHHVTGPVLAPGPGMSYECRRQADPRADMAYIPGSWTYIGRVRVEDMGRLRAVCEGVEVPWPQVRRNGRKIEGLQGREVRRCTEWVADVVRELRREGVVDDVPEDSV